MGAFDESDFESFSEASSEDQDDIFSIYSGQAQSILSSLEDSIGKIDDFLSFERGYVRGDIVCPVENPSGQMGRVVNVNMLVDLENAFGKVVAEVDAREVVRICSISVGDYVINGPWLGRVDKVVDCVGVVFDDGTKCDIMVTDPEMLMPVSANLLDDSLPYHPGQRVKVGLSFLPNSSRWLCGMSRRNHQEGTIYSVEAGSVYVDWLASALCGLSRGIGIPPPSYIQDPKNLTILSCFPHSNWQLGDWCALPVSEKSIEANTMYRRALIKEHKSLLGGLLKRDFSSKLEDMFVIVKRRSKVDVVWQDGSQSIGLDSCTLFPVSVVNASDFFPEQLVLEKTSCQNLSVADNERWGVVKFVDATERTVKVEWKTMAGNESGLDGKVSEELVSAYELVEHPDFAFSFGDIVFLLEKSHLFGQKDVSTMREMTMLQPKREVGDSDENRMRDFLSNIGNVIGFKDGDIQVQWASGTTTKVAPYEIIRVDKDDGSLSILVLNEDVSESNHEPVEQEKQSLQHMGKDSSNADYVNEVPQERNGDAHFLGFSHAAIGFLTKMATNLFGSDGQASKEQPMTHPHMLEGVEGENRSIHEPELLESLNISTEAEPMVTTGLDDHKDATLKQKLERAPENVLLSSCYRKTEQFKQFDIIGDCSDHHFVDGIGKGSALFQAKKGWLKKVQQEWSILEHDLPETIYVRIYEERMDLIRAAIVGASGTPYHDGLFFFDIFLPPDYPNEPPLVHYHSGGLRPNPNLYESGRVCLSLLNTWTGTGSEVWNPRSSTILQVLLSLQALVLNEKPYYNEAGYDKQVGSLEGEKNSFSYNENAFLVTCKSMLYHLRKPLQHFEGLVEEHFSGRSRHILSACKEYMQGAPIGSFGSKRTGAEREKGNSTGFKIMLAKLFPLLVEAFSSKGIDCSQFTEP